MKVAFNPVTAAVLKEAYPFSEVTLKDILDTTSKPRLVTVRFSDLGLLLEGMTNACKADPTADLGDFTRRLPEALRFFCPGCGAVLRSEALVAAATLQWVKSDNPEASVVTGGPNIDSLFKGCCPGCGCPVVLVDYFPQAITRPWEIQPGVTKCWFCESAISNPECSITHEMYGRVQELPLFPENMDLTQVDKIVEGALDDLLAPRRTARVWRQIDFMVPRCQECKRAHSASKRFEGLWFLVIFAASALPTLAVLSFVKHMSGGVGLLALAIAFFGPCLWLTKVGNRLKGQILRSKTGGTIKPLGSEFGYPVLRRLTGNGWEEGRRPPEVS